jgi:class II aldolase/adducin N-terminal domain-containing protein
VDTMRQAISDACRVLAARGVAEGILGHVSARTADGQVLVRTWGPAERGLRHTTPVDIRLVHPPPASVTWLARIFPPESSRVTRARRTGPSPLWIFPEIRPSDASVMLIRNSSYRLDNPSM